MARGRASRQVRKGPAKSTSYPVFISHSSRDNWIARVINERICAVGAQTWFDEKHLEGGDVLALKIIERIDKCAEAIVLVSSSSAESKWVAFEIGLVRGQHKRITPILHDVGPDAIALTKDLKAIDLNEFDKFLVQLKERIARR